MEEERGRVWGPRSGALSSISAGSTAERTPVSKETALSSQDLGTVFPKSREPAASTSDPQTGGQTPSLHPVTQETLDLGKEGLLPGSKESGEAGWAGCCHEGDSHLVMGSGVWSPALTSDASADAGTWAPELLESHRVPRGALTKPHQLLHRAPEGVDGPWWAAAKPFPSLALGPSHLCFPNRKERRRFQEQTQL